MDKLGEEAGAKEIFRRKLVMSRLKWPGRVERMELERLMKRADALILEGRRRR